MSDSNEVLYIMLEEIIQEAFYIISMLILIISQHQKNKRKRDVRYSMIERMPDQATHMGRLVFGHQSDCLENLRMDRNAFGRLCYLLRNRGGLIDGKFVSVEEQVAVFLSVLGHHKKNRVVKFDHKRSRQTISHYIHLVLRSVLQVHNVLLVRPTHVPNDCTNPRWKWFKGCLGALDGTYINVRVPAVDKGRYRTRKGQISTNVLAVCDRELRFVYVLPGWEGSASDARVLRDSVNRVNGLKVPVGNYYLCDNGYANSLGFLSPYRGVRYHLSEWGPQSDRPTNAQEHYNMRHTRARNVIERAFGIMKMRWGILRSASFYPIRTQIRLIMACFLLHNFIRNEMPIDPLEGLLDVENNEQVGTDENAEVISTVEARNEWSGWRDVLAQEICSCELLHMFSSELLLMFSSCELLHMFSSCELLHMFSSCNMEAQQRDERGAGQRVNKTGNTRRVWTMREERALISALKELVAKGWKSDNGFRTGYLTKLEDALKREFPRTDLQATPNITSKLTTWKKNYSSLVTAHQTTGVGFNNTTNQLDVTDEQWEDILKLILMLRDPLGMRGMRYKEWPLFPDWIDIFGKDRATGVVAEDVPDASVTINKQTNPASFNVPQESKGANYVNDESQFTTNNEEAPNNDRENEVNSTSRNATTRNATKPASSKSTGKKRKSTTDITIEPMVRMLGEFCNSTGERLDKIANRIGYDRDLGTEHKLLFEQLEKLPGLSMRDRIKVSVLIGSKVENLEIWTTLPNEARLVYVNDLLGK
ncbi:hypothetical protein ACS0TY_013574 [Phlomoides rotata]